MSLKQFIRFTNDASALEKTLRLLQGISQILAAYATSSSHISMFLLARRQFALGRRYIRFFRWIECFSKAWEAMYSGGIGLESLLVVGKWMFMGCFLGCESVGILDVMGLWPSQFARVMLIEGNKFWFYALLFSLGLGLHQLFTDAASPPSGSSVGGERKNQAEALTARKKRRAVKRKLVADACDLLVPGFVLGWIGVSSAMSAAAGCVSSCISMGDIWDDKR